MILNKQKDLVKEIQSKNQKRKSAFGTKTIEIKEIRK
jgi:hypothetical protein